MSADNALSVDSFGQNESSSYTIGTPLYRPPEFVNVKIYDQRADVFSLGLIYYEMLNDCRTMHHRYKILGELRKSGIPLVFRDQFPLESALIDFLVSSNYLNRPTSSEILSSRKFLDLLETYQINSGNF